MLLWFYVGDTFNNWEKMLVPRCASVHGRIYLIVGNVLRSGFLCMLRSLWVSSLWKWVSQIGICLPSYPSDPDSLKNANPLPNFLHRCFHHMLFSVSVQVPPFSSTCIPWKPCHFEVVWSSTESSASSSPLLSAPLVSATISLFSGSFVLV